MLTSTILWGQKRVGKTSIARVTYNELRARGRTHDLYVRKGDIAGITEGEFAQRLAQGLLTDVARRHSVAPSLDRYRFEHFTAITEVIDDLRDSGCACPCVVFLDEFDEFNEVFFRGPRGADFFATLRAVTERQVILILIGGERMPSIFRRHNQVLNKFATLRVDTIAELPDVLEMITKPVEDYISYDPEAASTIAEYAGRNPYYVNLICAKVLTSLLRAGRTFVDRTDVTRICHEIAVDPSITHWGHLWEDNDAEEALARAQRQWKAAAALSLFSGRSSDVGISLAALATLADTEAEGAVQRTEIATAVADLLQRGVLRVVRKPGEDSYELVVRLFKLWLNEHGRSILLPVAMECKGAIDAALSQVAGTSQPIVAGGAEFPIDDDELAILADGLNYRFKPVDGMTIKSWLKQFHDDAAVLLMFRLLTQLRERWYLDDGRLAHALNRAYDSALKASAEARVDVRFMRTSRTIAPEFALRNEYLRQDEGLGRIVNIYASYFGGETKSGAQVARRMKQVKRLVSVGELRGALDWLAAKGGAVAPSQRFVLITDDFVGSGHQFSTEALPALKNRLSQPEVAEAVREGRVAYFPLWAYRHGLEHIASSMSELRVVPVHVLDECDQAFAPEAEIFASDSERVMAKRIATHVGKQLVPDNPLGWSDLQSLIVFEEAVPNATLPLLWASGVVDERPWKPLFPR